MKKSQHVDIVSTKDQIWISCGKFSIGYNGAALEHWELALHNHKKELYEITESASLEFQLQQYFNGYFM